jgi:hypothetical protein
MGIHGVVLWGECWTHGWSEFLLHIFKRHGGDVLFFFPKSGRAEEMRCFQGLRKSFKLMLR